jgi:hypothetical protein
VEIETVADVRLAGRSINEEWPVTSDIREKVITKLIHLAQFAESEKVQVAATSALMKADEINHKKRREAERKLEAEHARKLQLIELAHKLGLVVDDDGPIGVVHSAKIEQRSS